MSDDKKSEKSEPTVGLCFCHGERMLGSMTILAECVAQTKILKWRGAYFVFDEIMANGNMLWNMTSAPIVIDSDPLEEPDF
jgi:hypothetical protein